MSQFDKDSSSESNEDLNSINKTNGISLQLELLANTNLLTIRIKWNNHDDNESIEKNNNITKELSMLINDYKGSLINPIYIESYDFLNEKQRTDVITSNNYTFETSTIIYRVSEQTQDEENQDWHYDTVIQCQLKNKLQLDSLLNPITTILEEYQSEARQPNGKIIDNWSISINNHALKHPGNIFIGNINSDVTLQELTDLCEVYGPILSIKLIDNNNSINNNRKKQNNNNPNDHNSKKNFGFVSFQLGSQASNCINGLNGKVVKGSNLLVNYHVERKERERLYWNQFKNNTSDPNQQSISHINDENNEFSNSSDENGENNGFNDLDDNEFKCVFIGNLPKYKKHEEQKANEGENQSMDEIITGNLVVEMINEKLKESVPDFEILSYYFPLENHETQLKGDKQSLIKGYGFIKVNSHEVAMKCLEVLNLMDWYGSKLIVNRAVQNRITYSNSNGSNNNLNKVSTNNNNNNNNNNGRQKSFSRSSSYLDVGPQQYLNISPYSQNMVPTSSMSSLSTRSSFMRENPNDNDFMEGNVNVDGTMDDASSGQSPTMFSPPVPVAIPNFIAPSVPMSGAVPIPLSNPYAATIPRNLPIPLDTQQESNLYVKHLPLNWSDKDLFQYYENFGKIISVKIITVGGSTKKENSLNNNNSNTDLNSQDTEYEGEVGSSKGYGFVCFENPIDASRAIMATNGVRLDMNHILEASFANKKNLNSKIRNGNGFNEPRYNPKFLNALIQEQNSHFMLNPNQGFSPVGSMTPHPSMMMPPQPNSMSPTNYNYPSNATNPIPTFVPVSSYGPMNMQFPNQQPPGLRK